MVLEKTLESPLDCKKIQPVSPKENQSWIFIERTDAEVEASILGKVAPIYWELQIILLSDADTGTNASLSILVSSVCMPSSGIAGS